MTTREEAENMWAALRRPERTLVGPAGEAPVPVQELYRLLEGICEVRTDIEAFAEPTRADAPTDQDWRFQLTECLQHLGWAADALAEIRELGQVLDAEEVWRAARREATS